MEALSAAPLPGPIGPQRDRRTVPHLERAIPMTLVRLIQGMQRLARDHRKRVFELKEVSAFAGESRASTAMTLLRGARAAPPPGRPGPLKRRVGAIRYHHIKPVLFFGFDEGRMAQAEKAW